MRVIYKRMNKYQLNVLRYQSQLMLRRYVALQFHRRFTVLALETSADDTCAAIITSSREILSNVVMKQHGE